MLTKVFSSPTWLSLIRSTPAFPYLDGFIAATIQAGYRPKTVQKYVRAAAHFSHWWERQGRSLADVDASDGFHAFKNHFATCQCTGFKRRTTDDGFGADRFLQYLNDVGIITLTPMQAPQQPPLLMGFCKWMRQHRGVKNATLVSYGRIITDALQLLGEDPARYDASSLRAYVLERAPKHGRSKAKLIVTTMRSFIRYLTAQGLCPVGLDAAIPTIAGWKLAALPRYLPAADVERVLASCDSTTRMGARDRAVLLLLARLGIRAGDVSNMRWQDIDWHHATLDITACKNQRAVRLPMPQEVGDALLHHLANAPDAVRSDPVILSLKPPLGRALGSSGVSCIVRRAIARAGVQAPVQGAHALRHSAATTLLAEGASLQSIGVLLRHRSLDTTTIYAKVDFKVLSTVVQPWPEVTP